MKLNQQRFITIIRITLKSKEPRLRDWNCNRANLPAISCKDLKSKEPRLRDWNVWRSRCGCSAMPSWNQKNLDYEIETNPSVNLRMKWRTWNQKNLDYEIETRHIQCKRVMPDAWNQKNLDYEIETLHLRLAVNWNSGLEIKRTSITRLKHCYV